jgi:hypothetical protein
MIPVETDEAFTNLSGRDEQFGSIVCTELHSQIRKCYQERVLVSCREVTFGEQPLQL